MPHVPTPLALIGAVVLVILLGIIFWLLNTAADAVPQEPFKTVAKVLLLLAAVIILIAIVMHLAGVPIPGW